MFERSDSPNPMIAAARLSARRAGLVDELQLIVCPVIRGGGKRFFPVGVREDLDSVDERRFREGVVVMRYGVRG
jgi:dihydrofolate reductase